MTMFHHGRTEVNLLEIRSSCLNDSGYKMVYDLAEPLHLVELENLLQSELA